MAVTHVIGAGLAGLSAAWRLAEAGHRVVLWEAAPAAGGRCRALADPALGRSVDAGSHLLVGAYRETFALLAEAGAAGRIRPLPLAYPFLDLADGRAWSVRPGRGRLPWWLLSHGRRAPGGGPLRHLADARRLLRAASGATVAEALGPRSPLLATLWRPLTLAILNAEPEEADAGLLAAALRESLLAGGENARPWLADPHLSHALVEPVLAALARRGADLRAGTRVRAIDTDGHRATALRFRHGAEGLSAADGVVVALPATDAARLIPDLPVPRAHRCIVNAHFRLDGPVRLPGGGAFVGLTGGLAHWLFARENIVSATVSAAGALADRPSGRIAEALWQDASRALGMPSRPLPPHRVVKERHATFLASPRAAGGRPGPDTRLHNVTLAGDWTDTGLPATIEGAVRSGRRAAEARLANG